MKGILALASLILIYVGLHTQLAVVYGGHMLVPFALCGVGGAGIIVLFLDRFSLAVWRWLFVLSGCLAIMAFITAMRAGDLAQRLVSAANLIYSLVLAYSAYVGITTLGIRWCSRIFLGASLILIVGSFLELYGGLRPISDAFRDARQGCHSQYSGVYGGISGDFRDETLYGHIRPKFFALEPSVLGISSGTAILYWFLSAGVITKRRLLAAVALAITAFSLIRSPTIFLCLFIICVVFVADRGLIRQTRIPRALIGACAVLGVIAAPFITTAFTRYTHGGSFLEREIIPGVMAGAVIRSYPLLGTGLGGYQQWGQFAFSAINSKWGIAGYRDLFPTLIAGGPYAARLLVSNGLWEFVIDCGLLGGAAILFCILRIMRELRVPDPLFVLCVAAIAFTAIGGISSAAEWIPLFTVAALYREHRVAEQTSADAATAPPGPG